MHAAVIALIMLAVFGWGDATGDSGDTMTLRLDGRCDTVKQVDRLLAGFGVRRRQGNTTGAREP
jgi:hypothetical protein